MGTEDAPEEKPTIAGRALRALRTTRPAEAEPVTESEPAAPAVDLGKPVADVPEPRSAVPAPEADLDVEPEPDPELVSDAEPAAAAEPAPAARRALLIASLAVLAAALAFAVVGVVVFVRGTDSSSAQSARTRDDVLAAARIDIATLNTLDYKDVRPGLQKWLNVTTGDFHDQIAQAVDQQAEVIAKAKRVTVGKVVAAAVTSLANDDSTASVIATVDRTITPEGGTSALDRNRYRATLENDGGVWKIAELSLVRVGLS